MTRPLRRILTVLILIPFLLSTVQISHAQEEKVGEATRVVKDVYGGSLAYRIKEGRPLKYRERIQTGKDSAADLTLLDGSAVVIGPDSKIILDDFIVGKETGVIEGVISMTRGMLRFVGSKLQKHVEVKTPTATIGIRGTAFDVHVLNNKMALVVYHGDTEVTSSQGTVTLGAGDFLEVDGGGALTQTDQANEALLEAVAQLLLVIAQAGAQVTDFTPAQGYQGGGTGRASLIPITQTINVPSEVSPSTVVEPEQQTFNTQKTTATADLVRMNLPTGPVVIKLRPDLAPLHVRRIKELVENGFYDGITFHRVVSGFVAQAGDPTGTGRGGSGQRLAAEFSNEPYVRGSVGMARSTDPNSADSQFFIVYGNAPSLVGAYSQWGQVISGMEHVESLAPGEPPAQPVRIISMELGWSGQNP